MDYVLLAEDEGPDIEIKTYPTSMHLSTVKKDVEKLAIKWEKEFRNWNMKSKFISKYLPGVSEGTDLILKTPSGEEFLLTAEMSWEKLT